MAPSMFCGVSLVFTRNAEGSGDCGTGMAEEGDGVGDKGSADTQCLI